MFSRSGQCHSRIRENLSYLHLKTMPVFYTTEATVKNKILMKSMESNLHKSLFEAISDYLHSPPDMTYKYFMRYVKPSNAENFIN